MKNCHTVLPSVELLNELFIYDPETGILTNRIHRNSMARMGEVSGRDDGRGYFYTRINKRLYANHRIIWAMNYWFWPENEIDHINGIPGDNRLDNLREATHAENLRNTKIRTDNSSGVKGVYWSKKDQSWYSQIAIGGKITHLGYRKTKEEAIAQRQAAEVRIHGEYRRMPTVIQEEKLFVAQ